MKSTARSKTKVSRRIRIFHCAQCGIAGPITLFQPCCWCDVLLHRECVFHHAVDNANDGAHGVQDYINFEAA